MSNGVVLSEWLLILLPAGVTVLLGQVVRVSQRSRFVVVASVARDYSLLALLVILGAGLALSPLRALDVWSALGHEGVQSIRIGGVGLVSALLLGVGSMLPVRVILRIRRVRDAGLTDAHAGLIARVTMSTWAAVSALIASIALGIL